MDKCFRLIVGATAKRGEVCHISGIRSHPPALIASVAPPWPPQVAWQAQLRRMNSDRKTGKP